MSIEMKLMDINELIPSPSDSRRFLITNETQAALTFTGLVGGDITIERMSAKFVVFYHGSGQWIAEENLQEIAFVYVVRWPIETIRVQ